MELWIRSQDKRTLRRVLSLDINGLEIMTSNVLLGIYKTKERALEILDEIQSLLKPKLIFHNCEISKETYEQFINVGAITVNNDSSAQQSDTYVYEMPQE